MVQLLKALRLPRKKSGSLFILMLVLVSGSFLLGSSKASAQAASRNDSIQSILLNNRAYWLYNHAHYDEAIDLAKQAVKLNKNVISYFLLGCIYNTEQKYAEAAEYEEKAMDIDTGFTNLYPQLFSAYYGTEQWEKAQRINEKAQKYGKNQDTDTMLQVIDYALKGEVFSKIMVLLMLITLASAFFYPIYKASKDGKNYFAQYDNVRTSEVILIASSVSCILWVVFFALSKWIWSKNPPIVPYEIVNYVRGGIYEHDGIESFFLYCMMFVNVVTTLSVTALITRLKNNINLYNTVFTVLLLLTCFYLYNVGFFPPLSCIDPVNVFIPALLAALAIGLYFLYFKSKILAMVCVFAIICYVGLIPQGPTSTVDFIYLLSPALRLLHGYKVTESYFQYDLYISLLLLALIKLNIAINWFPYVAQLSFFLFFIAAFFFGDGFFKTKGLSVLFIVGLILVRFYSIWGDNPTIIPVTPMRLDLWIVLLLIISKKNVHHWMLGVFFGLLIIFHRNLGLIYLLAYFQLLLFLFILDAISLVQEKKVNAGEIGSLFMKHLRANAVNLIIIASSVAMCFLLFHEMFSKSALQYSKLGIMFKQTSRISFYWQVTILLGSLISFIFFYRNKLGQKYVTTALYIELLVIGNSMYFFGRSHENNILNISGILVLALFVLFDILISLSPAPTKEIAKPQTAPAKNKSKLPEPAAKVPFTLSLRMVYLSFPVIFIFLAGYAYSTRITDKIKLQYDNLTNSDFVFPFPNLAVDTAAVREVTHNSDKVYIMDFWYDAYYYYYNGYAPQGFYSPMQAWVYKKDLVPFLQDLLDKGYYIGYDIREYSRYVEYFDCLNYNQTSQKNNIVVLHKNNTPMLLPATSQDLLHVAIQGPLASNGLDYSPVTLKDAFTIEMVFNPQDNQAPNAALIESLTSFDGTKGFTFRLNASNQNQFVFAFSNGYNAMPNNVFFLDYNKWHYIAIVENKEFLKIYDNGKLITNMSSGGQPIVNSMDDVTIGNQGNQASPFKGLIREVRISNGNVDEAEILKNAARIDSMVNGNSRP